MPSDLKDQLHMLIDAVAPVSADEAVARAEAYPTALRDEHGARRHLFRPIAVAASAVLLAGGGIGFALSQSSNPSKITHGPAATRKQRPEVILTATEVRAITSHSSAAAASSGTAEITQTSAQNGVPQDGYDTAITFSGQNIDEKITSVPEPPGSAKSFTTDDRFVDGQFYIYTPGPGDILEWLHDTNSANDVASMQFPDPRTLYNAISPNAQFAVDGTTTMNGETVTHLVAGDPSAINATALGNLAADSTLTSFEIWVDANDVVQEIALSTSETNQACQLGPLTKADEQQLVKEYGSPVTRNGVTMTKFPASVVKHLAGEHCGPMTTTANVTVAFANLGVPQSVVAPANPIDYAGKG